MKKILFFILPLLFSTIANAQNCEGGAGECTFPTALPDTGIIQQLQINFPTGETSIMETASDNITVYPNPANDVLNFRFNTIPDGDVAVNVYSMQGLMIDSRKYHAVPPIVTLQVGDLPLGMYFYEISNGSTIIRDRFIKE